MRDILTALAGVVILILVAALAAPPFVDWAAHRATIDRAIGSSLGVSARSEGRIEVRLLPSPRLRLDRLRVGDDAEHPALDAQFVKAEVALAPLLKGEFRFTETRIGRAEVKLPVTESEAVLLPPDFARSIAARDLVVEDLHVQQFLVTTQVPETGRTDQFFAENLRLRAPSLAGPWQIEGTNDGAPFRLASSTIAPNGAATIKLSGGAATGPRLEVDARVSFRPLDEAAEGAARPVVPEAEGTARFFLEPGKQADAAILPFTLGGKFKARGSIAQFEGVNAEIDPGGQSVRLAGSGQIDLRNGRAALALDGRRLDLDRLAGSSLGDTVRRGLRQGGVVPPMLLDLDLKVESVAFAAEEWADIAFRGTLDRSGGIVLRRFSANAPGAAKLDASGNFEWGPAPSFNGQLALEAADSAGFGRYLRKFGADEPALALLDGRSVQAAGEVSASGDAIAVGGLRLSLGEAKLDGDLRYVRADEGRRGRFEATLQARAIDIAELPPLGDLVSGLDRHDIALKVKARDVRYGPAGAHSGNGTIAVSMLSDGPSLVVDSLDVTDLAGANAKLSGRISPDGAGRIAGRVSAPTAAPLLALLDRIWVPEARLLPRFLREGGLDLDVTLEREAGEADSLRVAAKGTAADGTIEGSMIARVGRLDGLDVTIAAPKAGRWFGRADIAGLRQPAKLTLSGKRAAATRQGPSHLDLSVNGTVAGATIATSQPLALDPDQGPPTGGKVRIQTADLAPFLTLAGGALAGSPALPADVSITLSRSGTSTHAEIAGRVAETDASGQLDRASDGALAGKASFGRLSLPALASALIVPTGSGASGSDAGWSTARFAPMPSPPRADLALTVDTLDLGRGLIAKGAGFGLRLDGDSLTLRDLSAALAGGRIAGTASLARQGAGASISGDGRISDAAIRELLGETALRGRLSASVRFNTSGDTPAALMGNLGGNGEITLAGLAVPETDPRAIDRALARALAEDDPLREGRVPAILSEEFSAGPLETKTPVATAATLIGGTLRSAPVALDLGPSRWAGTFAIDLKQQRLDARGTLTAASAPKGWAGGKPSVQLGLSGPLAAPRRELDVGPLSNGLAALVLQRELEKIELFDADQSERQRRRARIDMDKARAAALKAEAERIAAEKAAAEKAAADKAAEEKAAAEKAAADKAAAEKAAREKAAADKAAREKAAAEEAFRAARARAQQAAAEEAARQARERREAEDAARRARFDADRRAPADGDPIGSNRPPEQ